MRDQKPSVAVSRTTDYCPVARYGFDALGRRISKQVTCTSGLNTQADRFYYDGSRLIEHWSRRGYVGNGGFVCDDSGIGNLCQLACCNDTLESCSGACPYADILTHPAMPVIPGAEGWWWWGEGRGRARDQGIKGMKGEAVLASQKVEEDGAQDGAAASEDSLDGRPREFAGLPQHLRPPSTGGG